MRKEAMEFDFGALEQGVTLRYHPAIPTFRRDISQLGDRRMRLTYQFGFPRIDPKRFGKVDIYGIDSVDLPACVKEYFTSRNDDQFCAYIYQFYPNGQRTKRNAQIIKRREGRGTGTAGFKLMREDLAELDIRNIFLTPLTEEMILFLEKRGFDRINMGPGSFYGKVL